MNNKLTVAVVFGGQSSEHDVSWYVGCDDHESPGQGKV